MTVRLSVIARWAGTAATVFVAAMATSACHDGSGSGNTDPTPGEDTGPAVIDTVVTTDTTIVDTNTNGDTAADSGSVDTSGPVAEGAFLSECTVSADCDSGWCVPTPYGMRCSKLCIEDCPTNWGCTGVSQSGDNVTFVCLHDEGTLCHPCDDNKACNFGVNGSQDVCVSYGAEGNFCGTGCATDSDCGDGYACQDVTSVTGAAAKQCVATSGVCECNTSAQQLGLSTTCGVTSDNGTCPGTRACGAAGLSACVGPGAQVEICNGADDDCDGEIDEDVTQTPCTIENQFGTCEGTNRCIDAELTCIGDIPTVEVCNGRDDNCDGTIDENFTDTDGDGEADCVDTDDDGDGVDDGPDCAPLDAAIFPGAAEVCNPGVGGVDEDCDGLIDEEGGEGCTYYLRDADGDGVGSSHHLARCLCGPDAATKFTVPDPTAGAQNVPSAADSNGAAAPWTTVSGGSDCNDVLSSVNSGATETCNTIDDNCDGVVDEGVQSPCGGCSPVCLFEVSDDGNSGDLDPQSDGAENLVPTTDGGLTLSSGDVSIPFAWIANSAENTVTKLDTTNGKEVARYSTCGNPSRTAVDINGDGIVTCRDDGGVMKIAILEPDCIDSNNNGVIDTSRDTNDNGTIEVSERVANDECILWTTFPDVAGSGCDASVNLGGCARAAGVDSDNNVWVGMWNSKKLFKLNGADGSTLTSLQLDERPYGIAIDGDNTLWTVSRSPYAIVRVDIATNTKTGVWAIPNSEQAYGMAIDHLGKIWMATGASQGLTRFDPTDGTFTKLGAWTSRGHTRGVAVKLKEVNGVVTGSTVYTAHHTWDGGCGGAVGEHRTVTVYDAATLQEQAPIDLGGVHGPVGVAIDVDGNLLTVNQCSSSVIQISTDTGAILGTYPVGTSPYTYSDMTGYALRTITSKSGRYRQSFEGWNGPNTRWRALYVDAQLPGDGITSVTLRYRVAASTALLSSAAWSAPSPAFPPANFPWDIDVTGKVLEVEVTMNTTDNEIIPTLYGISALAEQN